MPVLVQPLLFRGLILKWNGLLADIPKGFQICDGTNGTPDLRTKFVKGVLTNATNPGTTGGADTVTLDSTVIPSHNHSITETAHTHTIDQVFGASADRNIVFNTNLTNGGGADNTSTIVGISPSTGNTGGGGSHENRPAYYEVIFIMKVSDV